MNRIKQIPLWGVYALLAYMPFHIFLAQSLSLATGGLEVWKVAKDAVTIALLLLVVGLVAVNEQLRRQRKVLIIFGLASLYALLHIALYLVNKNTDFGVALLASTYNNRLFWYALIGMAAALLAGARLQMNTIIKLVLIVSTIVCLLGLLQWFLPKDILTHLGYSTDRGVKPNFLINENPNFPRVMSTIRDPNSLGAFLIVPILLLVGLLRKTSRRLLIGGVLALHVFILMLSFSRAAWGGMTVAITVFFLLLHAEKTKAILRRFWPLLVVSAIIAGAGLYSLKSQPFVRSVVFRIDDTNQNTQLDSDQLHAHFIEQGARGVAQNPLGYGPGTAGIVSIQNKNGSYLTENYYLQIAHEVGVLGLAVLLAGWGFVTWWLHKSKTLLTRALVAASAAYVLMALVMHLWTNEALAAQWWLLAGLAIGISIVRRPSDMIENSKRRKKA